MDNIAKGKKITPHDLLACCDHAERISFENRQKTGIRFFGKSGSLRALVVIQSHARKYL